MNISPEQLAALSANEDRRSEPVEEQINREEILKKELTPAQYEDMKTIMDSIHQIRSTQELRDRIGQGTMNLLDMASINLGHDKRSIVLSFDGSPQGQMAFRQFSKEEHRLALQDLVGELTGKQVDITCQSKDSIAEQDVGSVNLSKVNFSIDVEE